MPVLTERQVMIHFKRYRKNLINKLGKKATTDLQLTQVGRQLFGKKYIGTYGQDNLPWSKITPRTYAIINTDTKHGKGLHWIGLYFSGKKIYIFDSYGRATKRLLPIFTKQLKKHNYKIIESDRDVNQGSFSSVCGVLCLAWMCCIKDLGVRNALKV